MTCHVMRLLSVLLASLLAAGTCVAQVAPPQADTAAALRALADEYWAAYVERYPEIATYQGVTGAPHDRLTDNSLAAVAAWRAREDAWLARLRELAPRLDPASGEAIVAAILDDTLASAVATRVCRTELWSLSDAWPGWQGFLADWAAAQPTGDEAARRNTACSRTARYR